MTIPYVIWPPIEEDAKGKQQCAKVGHMYDLGGHCIYCDQRDPDHEDDG